ncbi:MAG: RdgB/HAM1 family non-canonical purine NTP pyrophosphatase [Finegoldia sp.]|nr:RdgB/HAM1 family non-canonical purine NTP pyrophosphatase [Finegoldia sp.]
MRKIYLSTGNKSKVKEIKDILKNLDFEIYSKADLGIYEDVEEDGSSLEENSLIKARYLKTFTDDIVISDDTGLFVRALDLEPGIYSARYAGEHASDQENREKLLKNLEGKEDRSAYFQTVISLIDEEGKVYKAIGTLEGKIADHEIGDEGFGYDKLFIPHGYEVTLAQMSPQEKNAISHRHNALENLKKLLEEI